MVVPCSCTGGATAEGDVDEPGCGRGGAWAGGATIVELAPVDMLISDGLGEFSKLELADASASGFIFFLLDCTIDVRARQSHGPAEVAAKVNSG